jgi:methylated-DNA-protein-cysteine methyltransferase related protein
VSAQSRDKLSETYRRIYAMVKKIPRGKVASYGQIARLCGMERQARLVGYALHALRDDNVRKVPWQRVINAKGYVSLRDPPYAASLQQRILESEGVEFDPHGKVNLEKYGWKR